MKSNLELQSAQTIPQLFCQRVQRTPGLPAQARWSDDRLETVSWWELAAEVYTAAKKLDDLGVGAGDHVVLLSPNNDSWPIVDLAVQFCGAVSVPLHYQLSAAQVDMLVQHCAPHLAIVASVEPAHAARLEQRQVRAVPMDELVAVGAPPGRRETVNSWLSSTAASTRQEDRLSILYTSGTVGEPKGVILSQRNVASNVFAKLRVLPLGRRDVRLVILPLSHVFARVCDLFTWIAAGCQLVVSRGPARVLDDLQRVRPTYLNAVPYYYEKWYRHLQQQDRLQVPDALSQLLGGRNHVCNCGGAAISADVFDYYRQCGINLVTGYGLTETSPVLTSSSLESVRRDAVGRPVPGVALRLAPDGEVLARGPNVTEGYYRNPDATAEAIRDGWFHTGDFGRFDADGFLYISGRKKETIVTTGGKNISPVALEQRLVAHRDIYQAVVLGDRRDYLTAIIVPSEALAWRGGPSRWQETGVLRQQLRRSINDALSDLSRHEQIGEFVLIGEPFSVENGLLTTKQGYRRTAILARYAPLVEQMYQRPAAPIAS